MEEMTTTTPPPLDLLACPRTGETLRGHPHGLTNQGGQVVFPLLDGVPALFAEPVATLGEWRDRLDLLLAQLEQHAGRLATAIDASDLTPAGKTRVQRLHAATVDHRARLGTLLSPLTLPRRNASVETHLALRTRLPPDASLVGYYANIHRDWAWGEVENTASLDLIRRVADRGAFGRTLVIGAGAGRLAWDIHQQLEPETTVALDFNPMLMLLLARLARGESIELYEFPLAPRRSEEQAILRTLAAPESTRPGFHAVMGDALRPPCAAGSFDTIITPWVIDILPEDPRLQMARINSLLAPDGRWLNFGSLNFNFADPKLGFSLAETLELVEQHGFARPSVTEAELPYMCSPASRHGRREHVVAFGTRKREDIQAPPRHKALPDWLVTGRGAVPALPEFRQQALASRIHVFMLELIDGRRSLKDMARVLEQQRLMTQAEAEDSLRNFLIRLYEDSRSGRSF